MGRRGAQPPSINEVREFGRLVEGEFKRMPRPNVGLAFYRISRADKARRWGSIRSKYRLWADFKKDKPRQRAEGHRLAQAERLLKQFEELSRQATAEFEERVRQVEAKNPHLAGWSEHADRQLKAFQAQANGVLLKLPPEARKLLRR
jgi:hypothetical protein